MTISVIPYIGGKHRIALKIAGFLHGTGSDTLVDVFGGSGAVLVNAGFKKRIYNDIDGDLVNLFRVLADDKQRCSLLRQIYLTPASRLIFEDHYADYISHGFRFLHVQDPVERAFRVFYRLQFAFGGKMRSGGFILSTADRTMIKEVLRYRRAIRRLASLGAFFRETALEALDFSECIEVYGSRQNVVLYVDPPYVGTENYYSRRMSGADHVFLAHQLAECRAAVVCTYYETPLIRDLYKSDQWEWNPVQNVKNSQRRGGQKGNATDWIIVKRREENATQKTLS